MSTRPDADELRDEYDFTSEELRRGQRGKYAERYAQGTSVVLLAPGVAEVFPDSRALRALAEIIKEQSRKPAA